MIPLFRIGSPSPIVPFNATVYPHVISLGWGHAAAGPNAVLFDAGLLLGPTNIVFSATCACVTEPGFPATDTSPGDRLDGDPQLVDSPLGNPQSAIIQNLSGMLSGNVYKLTCYMIDANGMQYQLEYRLVCGMLQ